VLGVSIFAGKLLVDRILNRVDTSEVVIWIVGTDVWESDVVCPGVEMGVCGFFLVDQILGVLVPNELILLKRVVQTFDILPFDSKLNTVSKLVEAEGNVSVPDCTVPNVMIQFVVRVAASDLIRSPTFRGKKIWRFFPVVLLEAIHRVVRIVDGRGRRGTVGGPPEGHGEIG
jgi:hypothetical protein